jgi:hypothetical protein
MSYRALVLIAAMTAAAPLAAQDAAATVDPGMTRAEVVDRLGKPLNERKSGDHTYLYYRNGCEKTCGMNDLVILDGDKVTDAIFRSPNRHYSGNSSSPASVKPGRTESTQGGDAGVAAVRKAKRGGIVIARPSETAAPATVTGVEVVPAAAAPNGAASAPPQVLTAPTPSPATVPSERASAPVPESGTGTSGVGTGGGGTAGGNAPQVTAPGGNSPQVGSPEPQPVRQGPVGPDGQRVVLPVPLPGAKINPADSVRALTPGRPTPLPGAKLNPADSIRAEQIRRQLADTTKKP